MRRERVLPWLLVIALACCSYTQVDEREVRSQASAQMDCDEMLLKIENLGSGKDDIARYGIRGCGQSKTYDCTQEGNKVFCSPTKRSEATGGEGSEVAGSVAAAAAGCACASLLGGGKSSSPPAATSQPSPMSSTPAR